MTEWWQLLASFVAGIGLGFVYFGGLWFSVRHLAEWRRPGLLMAASFLLRNAIVLTGFLVVMDGQWQRLVAAALGFTLGRWTLMQRLDRAFSVTKR